MLEDDAKPLRSWWEVADEAARERDPKRQIELTEELERALDERDKRLRKSA